VEKNVEKPSFSPLSSAPCLPGTRIHAAKVKNRPEIELLMDGTLVNK
jgi:hypothetical protein